MAILIAFTQRVQAQVLIVDIVGFLVVLVMEPQADFNNVVLDHTAFCSGTYTTGEHVNVPADQRVRWHGAANTLRH